jgi:hypothetical protein
MATKKAVTKKIASPKLARKPRAKKAAVVDTIYWVLSERSRLFAWKPIKLFRSYDEAVAARKLAETTSPYSLNGYKVDRVDLVLG